MRLLTTILLLLCMRAGATNYYFAANGNDLNPGTIAQPKQTLVEADRLARNVLNAGDSILFRRGDSFFGTILLKRNGNNSAAVVFGAYGAGARPIITGLQPITGWTAASGKTNVYRSPVLDTDITQMEIGLLNGKQIQVGSYPDLDPADKFNTMLRTQRVKSSTAWAARDNKMNSSTQNWVGADVVVRVSRWATGRNTIATHAGDSITLSGSVGGTPASGFGFWIINHPATLTKHGEWYYNKTTKQIDIYLTNAPSNYVIEFPVHEYGIDNQSRRADGSTLSATDYWHVVDLHFRGYNQAGLNFYSAESSGVFDCTIEYMGRDGIEADNRDNRNFTAQRNYIRDCGLAGINCADGFTANFRIQHNVIRNIGMHEFFGARNQSNGQRLGIWVSGGSGHDISYNDIDSTGYSSIRWNGNNTRVHHNFVRRYCGIVDDGGAIYCGNTGGKDQANRRVDHNIVIKPLWSFQTASNSTVQNSHGIYLDDASNAVQVDSNYVSIVQQYGDASFYLHNNYNVQVFGNIFFGGGNNRSVVHIKNDKPDFRYKHPEWDTTKLEHRAFFIKHNLFIARGNEKNLLQAWTKWTDSMRLKTLDEPVNSYPPGRVDMPANYVSVNTGIDSNTYAAPRWGAEPANLISQGTGVYGSSVYKDRTLKHWQSWSTHDPASELHGRKFATNSNPDTVFYEFINPTERDSVIVLPRALQAFDGVYYSTGSTMTLKPYTGTVLLASQQAEAPPPPPPPPQGGVVFAGVAERIWYRDAGSKKLFKVAGQKKLYARPVPFVLQNLYAWSSDYSQAVWTKIASTLVANATTDPQGGNTAMGLYEESGNSTSPKALRQTVAIMKDTVYHFSAYVKEGTRRYVQLYFSTANSAFSGQCYANFDLQAGTVTRAGGDLLEASIVPANADANGWWRISIKAKARAASAASLPTMCIVTSPTALRNQTYSGDPTKFIYPWGLQLNTGEKLRPPLQTTATPIQ